MKNIEIKQLWLTKCYLKIIFCNFVAILSRGNESMMEPLFPAFCNFGKIMNRGNLSALLHYRPDVNLKNIVMG